MSFLPWFISVTCAWSWVLCAPYEFCKEHHTAHYCYIQNNTLQCTNSSSQRLPWKRCKSDPLGSASELHRNSMALQLCRSTHVFAVISRTNVQSELAYLKMWHDVAPWQNLVKNSQINGLSITSSVLHHILDLCRLLYFIPSTSKLPSF